MKSSPRVLVIIPTHNHPSTLPYSLQSVLNQTFEFLDIVVIGDGVTDETRNTIEPFLLKDSRITFLDAPKGERHGESIRDQVIRNSSAGFVTYLGDDDLFFPNHIETMVEAIQNLDFVNPLPIFIEPDESLIHIPCDLSNSQSIEWHLSLSPIQNSISLTGVMHTRESYLRLPYGWRPAPVDYPTDLYMWQQYFQLDGFRAETLPISTTAKFHAAKRTTMSEDSRALELSKFKEKFSEANFFEDWQVKVLAAVWKEGAKSFVRSYSLEGVLSMKNEELSDIQNSKTWIWGSKLAKLINIFRRGAKFSKS